VEVVAMETVLEAEEQVVLERVNVLLIHTLLVH
jgi:hypothetical protein